MIQIPSFPEPLRKNDALFMYGATRRLPFVYCYEQHETEVVHGPACRPDQEIYLDRCRDEGVPVRRRRGGGGTVVLSSGMLIIVVVGPRIPAESITDCYSRIHRPLVELLNPLVDTPVREAGICDLAIGEQKILGSSLYLARNPFLFYYQSSLMVHSDLSLLPRYLKHPPREPDYRASRSHGDFCTTLGARGCALDAGALGKRICEILRRRLDIDA